MKCDRLVVEVGEQNAELQSWYYKIGSEAVLMACLEVCHGQPADTA